MSCDIIIPYELWQDGIELRYALRSACKHLSGIRDCYLVGDAPKWYTGKHIPFVQTRGNIVWKQRNIFEKVMAACANEDVSDTFLFMNDDHYLLNSYKAETFPWYYDGLMDEWIEHRSAGDYKQTLENTTDYTSIWGFYADVHCPCLYSKHLFETLDLDWNVPHGYAIKSCYINHMDENRPDYNHEGELINYADHPLQYPDLKIRHPMDRWELDLNLKDRNWFSTSDRCFNADMRKLMNELYPTPSRWEK